MNNGRTRYAVDGLRCYLDQKYFWGNFDHQIDPKCHNSIKNGTQILLKLCKPYMNGFKKSQQNILVFLACGYMTIGWHLELSDNAILDDFRLYASRSNT